MSILRVCEDVCSSRLRRLTALLLSGLVLSGVTAPQFDKAAQAKPHRQSHKAPKTKTVRGATVRVSTAFLRTAPGENKPGRTLLDKGHSAKVIGEKGDWVRLRLGSGTEGWVRADLLKLKEKTFQLPAKKSVKVAAAKAKKAKAAKIAAAKAKAAKSKSAKTVVAKSTPSVNRTSRFNRAAHAAAVRVAMSKAADAPKVTAATALAEETHEVLPAREVVAANTAAGDVNPSNGSDNQAIRDIVREVTSQDHSAYEGTSRGQQRARTALMYRGAAYRSGATGRGAFDCSGFMVFLLAREGKSLPRTAAEQFHAGSHVDRGALRSGDLVFFKNTYKSGISHVGLYIGNGQFIHAANRRLGVKVDYLSSSYYANHWAGARRPF